MPRVGFEPTASMSERAKAVHALDRATTVICILAYGQPFLQYNSHETTRMFQYCLSLKPVTTKSVGVGIS
jgi:hypothetical protein